MLRALVAEDDPTTSRLVGLALRCRGYAVQDAAEALAQLDPGGPPPTLAVVCLSLPGADALRCRLREDAALAGVPVVLLNLPSVATAVFCTTVARLSSGVSKAED